MRNSPLRYYLNIGKAEALIKGDHFGNLLREGGPVSIALNQVPGINSVSYLHDAWQNVMLPQAVGTGMTNVINPLSMLPAATVAYGALLSGKEAILYGMHEAYKEGL